MLTNFCLGTVVTILEYKNFMHQESILNGFKHNETAWLSRNKPILDTVSTDC